MAVNITLNEISEQLEESQESEERQEEHLKVISRFFIDWSRGKLDRAEAASEKTPPTMFQQGQKAGKEFDLLDALGLGALGANLASLVAGIGALTGSLAGLRGWETAALGQVKKLGDRLRNVFRPIATIGDDLDETVKAATKAGGIRAIGSNLVTKITTAADDLARSILVGFGVDPETGKFNEKTQRYHGADGKMIAGKNVRKGTLQMMDEAAGGLITRLTNGFDKVMGSVRAAGNAFDTYIAGPGAKLFGFLDGVLGISQGAADAAKFLKFMGRLLWPFGIFMSALDGIEAYKNTEGTEWEKFSAGISAFVGDFLGAPLDLLKNGLAWVLKKFGWNEESEQIKEFNIEEKIKNLVQGVLDFPVKAFEWIKTLFSDPTTALKQLWEGIMATVPGAVGAATTLLDIVWWPVNQFIDWVTKKLGWRSEDAPTFNLREEITGWVTDFWNWFTGWLPDIGAIAASMADGIKKLLPDWAAEYINIDTSFRNRTVDMDNETDVMSQQVKGGIQKTYTTDADIKQMLSYNPEKINMETGVGDPYKYQMPSPVIIQDNSTKSGGSTTINQTNTTPDSVDASFIQRRMAMGVPF